MITQNLITNFDSLLSVFGLLLLFVAIVMMLGARFKLFYNTRWEWSEFGIVSTPKKNAQIISVLLAVMGIVLMILS